MVSLQRLAISTQLSCYCTAIAMLCPCTRRECLDASRAAAAALPRRVSGRRADLARARPGEGSRILRRGDEGLPWTPWLGCPRTSMGPGSCARSAQGASAAWSSRAILTHAST